MSDVDKAVDGLLDYWLASGVELNPGVSPSELDAFEVRQSVTLPASFRALYLRANGMGGTDDRVLSLWSLSQIGDESGVSRPASEEFVRVVFADGMISAHFYAIRVYRDRSCDVVVLWNGRGFDDDVAFSSFEDFLRDYPREGILGL